MSALSSIDHTPEDEWFVDNTEHKRTMSVESVLAIPTANTFGGCVWTVALKRAQLMGACLRGFVMNAPTRNFAHVSQTLLCGVESRNGLSGYMFSPWQRFSMSLWLISRLIDQVTCNVYERFERHGRLRCFREETCDAFVVEDGACQRISRDDHCGLCDRVRQDRLVLERVVHVARSRGFERLKNEIAMKSVGTIVSGSEVSQVARLALVVTQPATHAHFVDTMLGLVDFFKSRFAMEYEVWTTVTSCNDVAKAWRKTQANGGAVVWILPSSRLMEVLRKHPEIAVAVCRGRVFGRSSEVQTWSQDRLRW